MHVEFLHALAGGLEIFAGVKLCGLLGEGLADCGGHSETAVAIDVDLADCALGGLAELLLGDADGLLEGATVSVDGIDLFLRHGAGAVEDDGEAGELLLDCFEDVEGERRRQQTARLRIDSALLGGELIGAVAGADRDGETVAASLAHKVDNLFGLGVVALSSGDLVFDAGKDTELALDGDVELVSILNNLLGDGQLALDFK